MKTFIRITMVAAAIVTLNSCGLFDNDDKGQAIEEGKPAVEVPVDTTVKETPEVQTPDTTIKEEVKPESDKAVKEEPKTK